MIGRELTATEIELVAGGHQRSSGDADERHDGGLIFGIASSWASTVAGAGVGSLFGGLPGVVIGGLTGFTLGVVSNVAYSASQPGAVGGSSSSGSGSSGSINRTGGSKIVVSN